MTVANGAKSASSETGVTVRVQKVRRDRTSLKLVVFAALAIAVILVAAFAPFLCPYDPYIQNLSEALQPPSAEHWAGTDRYGRDLLSRIIIGSQSSIFSTLALVAIIAVVGTAIGVLCGWKTGKLDVVLMRTSDVFLAFPGLVFALASALAFAIYTVIIQVTGRTEGSFTVTFTLSWTSLLASCIIFAPSVPTMFALTPYQIGIGCTMALANTILPVVLYIQAVKHIGGTKTSLIGISETPFSLFFAFLILGETIAPMEGVGIVFVIAGIAAITVGPLLQKKE